MEGAKLKNIVILILVLLNAFLLVLSGGRRMQDARTREQARAAAVQVIRQGGVALDEQIVPEQMDLLPMRANRDTAAERLQAQSLLGGEVETQVRGGEVYRYSNSAGWLQVHGTGQFSAQLAQGTAALNEETAQQHAVSLLARLDMQSRVESCDVTGGQGTVVLTQMLGSTPLTDCRVEVCYENNCAVSISGGRRLLGVPEREAEGTPVTVATALMRLYNGLNDLGDIYSGILEITPTYALSVDRTGSTRLTPVWQVRTDTGVYRLDTLTGELTRTGPVTARSGPEEADGT